MIKSVRIKNFKALRDTGILTPHDLTVFIGNNGSGKSSVIEALSVLHTAVFSGLAKAFEGLGRMEDVRHYAAKLEEPDTSNGLFTRNYDPISWLIECEIDNQTYIYEVLLNTNASGDFYVIEKEELTCNGEMVLAGKVIGNDGLGLGEFRTGVENVQTFSYNTNVFLLSVNIGQSNDKQKVFYSFFEGWLFLNMNAQIMGQPASLDKAQPKIQLKQDASNISVLVRYLAGKDPDFMPRLIAKMQFVLPYVESIRANSYKGFTETTIFEMFEQGKKGDALPGWLFSSGTLRILALLAVFNQPELPTTVFIDEIENGLDPRTIGMLLDEIRNLVLDKRIQVIVTTHSPYFLDMIELRHIVVAEKEGINTLFSYPDSDEKLSAWKEKFSPGSLYTSGRLTK